MPSSAFFAVLRNVAKLAAAAADDLAVGASKMTGVSPAHELPAIWRIFRASALNKVWLIALVLAVDALFPLGIPLALVAGGLYLAFDGGKAVLGRLGWDSGLAEAPLTDEQRIRGAIVTGGIVGVMLAAAAAWIQRLVVRMALGGRRRPAR